MTTLTGKKITGHNDPYQVTTYRYHLGVPMLSSCSYAERWERREENKVGGERSGDRAIIFFLQIPSCFLSLPQCSNNGFAAIITIEELYKWN